MGDPNSLDIAQRAMGLPSRIDKSEKDTGTRSAQFNFTMKKKSFHSQLSWMGKD